MGAGTPCASTTCRRRCLESNNRPAALVSLQARSEKAVSDRYCRLVTVTRPLPPFDNGDHAAISFPIYLNLAGITGNEVNDRSPARTAGHKGLVSLRNWGGW